jgi:hypothetical protein
VRLALTSGFGLQFERHGVYVPFQRIHYDDLSARTPPPRQLCVLLPGDLS